MTYTLYNLDCLELMRTMDAGSVDCVITDPPYPDYYREEYLYYDGILDSLLKFNCRQFIFWTAKIDFPLDYTAVHIWDKKTGCGSEYERIFERNGQKNYKVFRHYLVNSTVAASYAKDIYTGHPSQKPINLLKDIVLKFTVPGSTVFDPFAGSFTTGVACVMTDRNFIGCERDEAYFKIGEKRIHDASQQMLLPLDI